MRAVGKLSAVKVTALARAGKPGLYGDGAGLALRISRGGAASWAFRYMKDGRAHELGLGAFHTFSLAEARERARKIRQQLADGADPLAERQAKQIQAMPFSAVAKLYLAAHEPAWRSPIHARQWDSTLRDYINPIIGALAVDAIDTGAVMRVLEPLWHAKPETASRIRGRIEAILDYATARGWRTGENPARWRGHLQSLLPARSKVAAVQHHPALAWPGVPALMTDLAGRRGIGALALRFTALTAVRSGEARGARWSEIDLDGAVWTIPAARMKAHQEHRVPLAGAALAILRDVLPLRDAAGDPLVFPGAGSSKPLSDVAVSKLLPAGATVHGLRSSFRDWAGETTAYPREVIEMALAHRLGDKAEQAYAGGDLFQKRRALMTDWATFATGG